MACSASRRRDVMDIGGRVEPVGHHGAVRCRSACALRGWWGGGDEAQTPGATVVRCYKSLPNSILWLRATLLFTFWSRSSLQTYFWAKVSTKATWRRASPLVLGLGRLLGGGAAPRSFDRQLRAHGQIHCHVSVMSASSVHVIGGAFQSSWPA